MAITKKQTGIGGDVEKVLYLHIDGGNAKWCSHYGSQYGRSSKKIKHRITERARNSASEILNFNSFKEWNARSLSDICTPMF